MRTDSPKLSDTAIEISQSMLKSQFNSEYLGTQERLAVVKAGNAKKNAQEAHEVCVLCAYRVEYVPS